MKIEWRVQKICETYTETAIAHELEHSHGEPRGNDTTCISGNTAPMMLILVSKIRKKFVTTFHQSSFQSEAWSQTYKGLNRTLTPLFRRVSVPSITDLG